MKPPTSRARRATVAGLLTILALAIVPGLVAQVPLPDRRPPLRNLPRPVERQTADIDAARTRVAFNPADGGWVVVHGSDWSASTTPTIPAEMRQKLEEFLGAGRRIDAIEFTPDGGWAIVAGDAYWTRGVGGQYHDEVGGLIRQGRRIRAVAFNPVGWERDRGFVIVHDGGVVARGIPAEMRARLDEYRNAGRAIHVVEFTPDGGWTILADGAHWTRNIGETEKNEAEIVRPGAALMAAGSGSATTPTSYFDRLREVVERNGFSPHAVAFAPHRYEERKGYLIVSGDAYWAQDVPPRLGHWLESARGLDGMFVRTRGEPSEPEQPSAAAESPEPEVVAQRKTGVIDLRTLHVETVQERAGDEPYIVVYPLRGRIGVRDRLHVWNPESQLTTISGLRNWARAGSSHDIPASVGTKTFEDLEPFEVYGVVVIVAERDPGTSEEDRLALFHRGIFRDDVGIWDLVTDRFDRAIPFDAERPDYDDLSRSNVKRVVDTAFRRLGQEFSSRFTSDLRLAIEQQTRGNGDDILAYGALFGINAPGLADHEVTDPDRNWTVRRAVGSFSTFPLVQGDLAEYRVSGAHRLYVTDGKE